MASLAQKHPANLKKTKVLLVDDHSSVREGLRLVIDAQSDLNVCGEAMEVNQALDAITNLKPAIAVIDISLDGRNGIELIKDIRLRWPRLPVLVFSMHDETVYAERAIRAGARGFVHKRESIQSVLAAIRRIMNGEIVLSEKLANRILRGASQNGHSSGSAAEKLTDRELEVFQLIGEGHQSQEIARELGMSERTVETHRVNLRRKLGVVKASQLLRHAIRWMRDRN
jgi:DNA-binding NarL/FixJ family response regulator